MPAYTDACSPLGTFSAASHKQLKQGSTQYANDGQHTWWVNLSFIAPFNCIFRFDSSLEFVLFVISLMFAEQQLARPCLLVCGAQARYGQPHDGLQIELGKQKACQSLQARDD